MSEIDQQFVEFVVKSLVGKPDAVSVKRTIDEKGVLLELTVDPEDLGRVIGKRGATAQSLRTLLRALGTKNDARYNLKIVDNGVGGPKTDRPTPSTQQDSESDEGTAPAPEEPAEKQPEAEPEPAEQPADEADEADEEDETSDRVAQARRELADLDDLDV